MLKYHVWRWTFRYKPCIWKKENLMILLYRYLYQPTRGSFSSNGITDADSVPRIGSFDVVLNGIQSMFFCLFLMSRSRTPHLSWWLLIEFQFLTYRWRLNPLAGMNMFKLLFYPWEVWEGWQCTTDVVKSFFSWFFQFVKVLVLERKLIDFNISFEKQIWVIIWFCKTSIDHLGLLLCRIERNQAIFYWTFKLLINKI